MEFWALENADDATTALFGVLIIISMLSISVVVLVDFIKRRKNGKG